MIRRACLAALLLFGRAAAAQTVTVRDAGPGPVGGYLTVLLQAPTTRVIVGDTVAITKDSTYPGAVVIIARRATVSGTVRGDVVVVGGDLFARPNARIEGQGVAIGGGAYGTLLGTVSGGLVSYRDFTYDVERVPTGLDLRYRETYARSSERAVSLPGLFGVRLPNYDRSNGVSLPVGPAIETGRVTANALATYRSQLGRVDPSIDGQLRIGRKLWIDGFAGRETRSNEAWINGPFANSLNTFLNGHDERNWYRATGGWATINKRFETATLVSTYAVGGSFERSVAARPGLFATSGPWSILERKDRVDGMYRPNPQVTGGDVTSVIGVARYQWTASRVRARLDVNLEVPVSVSTGENFQQATINGRIDFPTFGVQRYRFETHAVVTMSDTAPGQRFAYLGGSGTLPTIELLEIGGDEMLFVESRYEIPLPAVKIPFLGSPMVTLRHILGSAGVQTLPDFTQIIGLRLSVPFLRAQVLYDTGQRKSEFSAGLSLTR